MRKYASLEVLESWQVPRRAGPAALRKIAHRVAFDYDPRPGYLYVRSRMISSRTNDNHDTFPAGEIEKGYKTFLGKPVFVNHHNSNHRRARGVIVAIALHRDRNPDRTPDTWVEGLMEIDALRFPKLAMAIIAGKVNRTSMGVDVEWSHCSACGNKATSPAEYCKHLPALKGKKIRKRNPVTGKVEEKLIHEVCAGLSFFENSLLVEDPADPTAYLLGKPDDRGLSAAASKHQAAELPVFTDKASSCINCGKGFRDGQPGQAIGDWRNGKMPYLCNDCAYGHTAEESFGKPPALDITDKGGMGSRQNTDRLIHGIGEHDLARKWTPDDETLHSLSSRHAAARRKGGDHPFFKDNPVSSANVVGAYHDTTQDEKALGDRWYSDAHHVAKSITGGDAAKGAGLLSAYSPQTAWPVNMFNASRAAQGDPPGPGSGAMGIHQKSAMRILGGEHHSAVLKAPKTAAFAHLIEHGGDTKEDEKNGTEKVVVDRHALSVAVGRRLGKEEGSKAPLGQGQHYEHVAQAYREAAHILSKATGRKISPHQVQAATWLRQIRKNQEEDTSGRGGGGLGAGKGRVQMQNNSKTRWEQHHRHHHPAPHHIDPENMHYHGLRAQAYGETRVPPDVDTLRMEECPVCGEHDVWSGSRCPVCGFIVPPSLFRDPDTGKAQQVRDELDQSGEVVTQPGAPGDPSTQQIGSGQDADSQLSHPDQVAPDGTPGIQEGGPLPPMAQDGTQDPAGSSLPPDGREEEAGGAAEEEQGEEDQEQGAEEEAEGQQLERQGEEDELAPQPDLMCPACGAAFTTDMGAQPGTPCPACRQGSLQPAGGPPEGTEDPAEDEDEGEEMAGSKTAAALARAQAHRVAVLTAENEVLTEQLRFLGSAAGVEQHLAAIRRNVMRKHADMLNPASPVPDPPEAPPTETTEQALAPETMDDPSRPGTTPGANTHVPAQQTTTAITPGVEMQTPPATSLIDVTAPVTGTNPSQDGGVPLDQRRIETDVRIDPDPLKAHGPGIGGQGDNGSAFPWILDAQPGSQQKQGQGQRAAALHGGSPLDPLSEADASRRTFASIRLAKLRIATGSVQGEELAVAERIEKDASLSTTVIEHEIGVLGRIQQTAAMPVQQRPVQRQAARQAPSLASVGASMGYAPAAMAADDDGSDIFL